MTIAIKINDKSLKVVAGKTVIRENYIGLLKYCIVRITVHKGRPLHVFFKVY